MKCNKCGGLTGSNKTTLCAACQKHLDDTLGFIYLAGAYSGTIAERINNHAKHERAYARLTVLGVPVFAPIVQSHAAAMSYNLPGDWAFWEKFDRTFIVVARELWVLQFDGWDRSVGVKAEIALAIKAGKPVRYFTFDELERAAREYLDQDRNKNP